MVGDGLPKEHIEERLANYTFNKDISLRERITQSKITPFFVNPGIMVLGTATSGEVALAIGNIQQKYTLLPEALPLLVSMGLHWCTIAASYIYTLDYVDHKDNATELSHIFGLASALSWIVYAGSAYDNFGLRELAYTGKNILEASTDLLMATGGILPGL